jgi:hypothetical protein
VVSNDIGGSVTNCYWKYTGSDPYLADPVPGETTPASCRSFTDAPGTLDSNLTVGGLTTNNLSTALNTWVDINGGVGAGHYNWTSGTTTRYPRLTPVIRVGKTPVPQTLTEGFAVGASLTETMNTATTYANAHPGTTAESFGKVLTMADAMGFKFANLTTGNAILNFQPSIVVTGFARNPWSLTFSVANGIDANATAAMNRLAGSTAGLLTVRQMDQPGGAATPLATQIVFHGDGTANATFNLTNPPSRSFFRLMLEHHAE